MELSITTDYVADCGDPSPYLRRIAEQGFTHIHWCHHWRSDFLYADSEIEQIGRWLAEYGLQLNDVHGSEGVEKFWYARAEYARIAGMELVKNRIDFTARLGADAVVMHAYPEGTAPTSQSPDRSDWDQLRRSLDELQPYALQRGVRIALENLIVYSTVVEPGSGATPVPMDNFELIGRLLDLYPPEFLGLCYDSGHANLGHDRSAGLVPLADRLYVLHLHDNDGRGDQHRLIFSASIDWERLATLIAASAYAGPMSMEISMKHEGIDDEREFLRRASATGARFTQMVGARR